MVHGGTFLLLNSKCLLDYACFHKGDLKEADRDSRGHSDSHGRSRGDQGPSLDSPGRGLGDTDFSAFSHKVLVTKRSVVSSRVLRGGNTKCILCCLGLSCVVLSCLDLGWDGLEEKTFLAIVGAVDQSISRTKRNSGVCIGLAPCIGI